MQGTRLLLLSFLAYLVLGTVVFWSLEGRMSGDPSRSFQRYRTKRVWMSRC